MRLHTRRPPLSGRMPCFGDDIRERFEARRSDPMAMGTPGCDSPPSLLREHPSTTRGQPESPFMKGPPARWSDPPVPRAEAGDSRVPAGAVRSIVSFRWRSLYADSPRSQYDALEQSSLNRGREPQ